MEEKREPELITRKEFNRLALEIILLRLENLKSDGGEDITKELPVLMDCARQLI